MQSVSAVIRDDDAILEGLSLALFVVSSAGEGGDILEKVCMAWWLDGCSGAWLQYLQGHGLQMPGMNTKKGRYYRLSYHWGGWLDGHGETECA